MQMWHAVPKPVTCLSAAGEDTCKHPPATPSMAVVTSMPAIPRASRLTCKHPFPHSEHANNNVNNPYDACRRSNRIQHRLLHSVQPLPEHNSKGIHHTMRCIFCACFAPPSPRSEFSKMPDADALATLPSSAEEPTKTPQHLQVPQHSCTAWNRTVSLPGACTCCRVCCCSNYYCYNRLMMARDKKHYNRCHAYPTVPTVQLHTAACTALRKRT